MKKPIVWASVARDDLAKTLEYVDQEFGTDTALSLLDDVEKTVSQISSFPNIYPVSKVKPGLRKAVVNKYSSIIYRNTEQRIEIIFFWNNRKNIL